MSGELHPFDGKAARRQRLSEEPHLERRPREAMHEENSAIAVTNRKWL
jgi:hypothetical protein